MRVGELSRSTGVPVPTIKYYLREGLLEPGSRTGRNQASYDQSHVSRLRLVRALMEVGRLSIARTRIVLEGMAAPGLSLHQVAGKVQYALTESSPHVEDDAWQSAGREVSDVIRRRHWQLKPNNPAVQTLTEVLATLHRLGQDDMLKLVDRYAEATDRLATAEVGTVRRRADRDAAAEGVVVATVLGDALIAALRRLAQENASWKASRRKPRLQRDLRKIL